MGAVDLLTKENHKPATDIIEMRQITKQFNVVIYNRSIDLSIPARTIRLHRR
ncbi:MAG: hypothetical protein IPM55_22920 [Acidobacteria bacterium]|nr:hypothetical protein [Acidobacteriota bacterium]